MKRSIIHLQKEDYKIVGEIPDQDLSTTISTELRRLSPFILLYFLIIISVSIILIGLYFGWISQAKSSDGFVFQLMTGFILGIMMIPFHELVHGLFLKLLGCRSINYSVDIKKMKFSTSAHHFVLVKREYVVFVLFPFLFVLLGTLSLCLFLDGYIILILAILLMHTSYCGGDFVLANYAIKFKKRNLKIYYDKIMEKTIFLDNN